MEVIQKSKNKSNRSKKNTLNLEDFVVTKKKQEKSSKNVNKKVSKKINTFVRRGKFKRKTKTTFKKKIIQSRNERKVIQQNQNCDEIEEDLSEPKNEEIIENIKNDVNKINEIDIKLTEITLQDNNNDDKKVQFSRNFREYCNHFITQEIRDLTEDILKSLFKFQENKFHENPTRAKSHKRYVVGFKEVKKFLVVGRLKLVIFAPDLERNVEVDKIVNEMKQIADEKFIPYLFGIKRRKIGFVLLKKVPVSVVGIFDYQGIQDKVNELMKHVNNQKIQ